MLRLRDSNCSLKNITFIFSVQEPVTARNRSDILYSGKIWWGLNLAKRRKKGCILILAKFKFGDLELYLYASSPKLRMETFEINSCIRGYHVFEII